VSIVTLIKNNRYGLMTVLVLLMALNSVSYGNDIIADSEKEKYITELVAKSKELKLSGDPYWHTILHYKKNLTGGHKSLMDDPKFFFAENGKINPEAELEATVRGFFNPLEDGKIHPTVKFSARYSWLKEQLGIDTAKLPYDGDIWFNQFYKEINPSTISLVFPAGYMNSPASMYGHTLLLIDSEGQSRLLSRVINYAASTNDDFVLLFAYKGLFGSYKGFYSFLPYYQKIAEYNDGEMRDMWEYEINFTPAEKERMIRHIIEMEDIYSDYFFIDENCSYNLLFLVEAARPETKITDAFGFGVEPIDTLRAAKEKGLVVKRTYRPSLYSKIQYLRTKLSSREQGVVLDFCKGKSGTFDIESLNLDEEKKIIMCDLASNYLMFMAAKYDISAQDYRSRFLSVLTIRNSLGKSDPLKDIPVPTAPEYSHQSRKIALESGLALQGLYSQITYRQSCHELMDPDDGYNMNSEILFGNISGRYYYEDKKFVLQRFDMVNVISLPPSDSFNLNNCYDFKLGLIQNVIDGEDETLSFQIKGATGISTLLAEKVQVYFFGGIRSYFAPSYENNSDILGGCESGILTVLGPWKSHLYAQIYHAPFGEIHTRYVAGASERIKITDAVSVIADYSYNKDYSFQWHEFSAKVNFYF
jgi:hypothetical protein